MTSSSKYPPLSELVSLKGKHAIITGGAMGIGLAIALRFAEAGTAVAIADVKREEGEKAARDLSAQGHRAIYVQCDVSQENEVISLINTVTTTLGGVNILVNNAGIFPFGLMPDMTPSAFSRVLEVNLKGAYICAREASKQMIAQGRGGAIINICSIDSLRPSNQGLAAYDASKGGLLTLTKSLALELGPHHIRVNAIAPGGIMTEGTRAAMTQRGIGSASEMRTWLKNFLRRTVLGRMGNPDEIARAALFLASELSAYMTGSLVVADGGQLIT